jgi:hypothetical protein
MGWIVLIVIALVLMGMISGLSSGEHKSNTGETDEKRPSEVDDDQMLEDWYASQELDNDLDDWRD